MADIIFWKANEFRGTLYTEVFEVADYEFDIGFSEFKMADPTWCYVTDSGFQFISSLSES